MLTDAGVVITRGHTEARVTRVEAGIGDGHPPSRGGDTICDVRRLVMINYSLRSGFISCQTGTNLVSCNKNDWFIFYK